MFIKVYKIIAASDANQHFNFLNNASIRSSFEDQKTGVPLYCPSDAFVETLICFAG